MPDILSIVGKSGSGKTTFLEKLLRELTRRGHRIGTIKHAHHGFSEEPPQKDSARHKAAGAHTVIVAGPGRIALLREWQDERPAALSGYFEGLDLIITEGYKSGPHPKIEVIRRATGKEPIFAERCDDLIARVTDGEPHPGVATFGLEEIDAVADLIERRFLR